MFISPDDAEPFLSELTNRVAEGWLAAILLPRRWEDNPYLRCDAGYTGGEFHRSFPVIHALKAARQIADIMAAAHVRHVIYLIIKSCHYYWNDPPSAGLCPGLEHPDV